MDNYSPDPGSPGPGLSAPGIEREDGAPARVLVVDDEPSLAELLASVLRYEGWTVKTAGNGADAVRTAREFRPDAVVLDVMLPDFSGIEVMRRLRVEIPQVCVLFLTARDAVEDRIAGITAGGDDYVTKPFSLEEVLARLRAVTRRASPAAARPDEKAEAEIVVGPLRLNPGTRRAVAGDKLLDLTALEFDLLACLARSRGRVKSREELVEAVAERNYDVYDRSVDVHIWSLRKKLGDDPKRPRFIRTFRSVGYMLINPDLE